ncbi:MAG: hypothetical protein AAGE84_16525 [Cyanobacteria bacterium P01_G01_bin.39]
MQYSQLLVKAADQSLALLDSEEDLVTKIKSSKEKFEVPEQLTIQLYGVSQAGKSTLFSCLTLGEQYIPIGTGTATTAVKVELISVASPHEQRAEIELFDPKELFKFVESPIQKWVLEEYENVKKIKLSQNLSREREVYKEILNKQREFYQEDDQKQVGTNNDIKIAEVILSHYGEYAKEYLDYYNESQKISKKIIGINEFNEIENYTRQPIDWDTVNIEDIKKYDYKKLKSFFTKKIKLYVSTIEELENIYVLDTPGFGVTNIHDTICRDAQ